MAMAATAATATMAVAVVWPMAAGFFVFQGAEAFLDGATAFTGNFIVASAGCRRRRPATKAKVGTAAQGDRQG